VAGKKLRAKDGWNGNGTDDFGFSALPGGCRGNGGDFGNIGDNGHWWSATERDGESAYRLGMFSGGDKVYRKNAYKEYSFSVRLVRD